MAVIGYFMSSACSISRNRPTAINESPPRSKKFASTSTDESLRARDQIAVRRSMVGARSISRTDLLQRRFGGPCVLCLRDLEQPGTEDGACNGFALRMGKAIGQRWEFHHL